jgi:DNA-binding NarL/FixJ family response regulator
MPKTVLVADDSPLIREQLRRMFEKEQDYDLCAEAEDGIEAIALAKQYQPDLIILDMAMPGMDGITAAFELKRIVPDTPIILFTVHAALLKKRDPLPVDIVVEKDDPHLMHFVRSLIPVSPL